MQRSHRLATTAGIIVATVAAGLIGGVATGTPADATPAALAPADASTAAFVLTDQQKQDLELHVLGTFVPYAETFWRASDIAEANTGRYVATGAGVTQARGAGDIAFPYATLLTASPAQQSVGGVSRATMLDTPSSRSATRHSPTFSPVPATARGTATRGRRRWRRTGGPTPRTCCGTSSTRTLRA